MSMGYGAYRKPAVTWLTPWTPELDMNGVSVSDEDTPGWGGFVAINPENPADRWYVAKDYAERNYVPIND